jgi:hypothetical protein
MSQFRIGGRADTHFLVKCLPEEPGRVRRADDISTLDEGLSFRKAAVDLIRQHHVAAGNLKV